MLGVAAGLHAPPRGDVSHSLPSSLPLRPASRGDPSGTPLELEPAGWRLGPWHGPSRGAVTARGHPINTLNVREVWPWAGFG